MCAFHPQPKKGTPSKKVDSPELDEIQRDAQYIHEWIEYSTLDSESTWYVREELERLLRNKPWKEELTMWNFYCQGLFACFLFPL